MPFIHSVIWLLCVKLHLSFYFLLCFCSSLLNASCVHPNVFSCCCFVVICYMQQFKKRDVFCQWMIFKFQYTELKWIGNVLFLLTHPTMFRQSLFVYTYLTMRRTEEQISRNVVLTAASFARRGSIVSTMLMTHLKVWDNTINMVSTKGC